MSNVEVYNNLNDKTKEFVNAFLSFFDKLNEDTESTTSKNDKLEYACFLATLYNSVYMQKFFVDKDIYYTDFDINCDIKKAADCDSFRRRQDRP